MSIHRWNAKTDATQATIVRALIQAGVQVWVIKQPCDLLCYFWSNRHQAFIWQPLEVKTPRKSGKPRKRTDQPAQNIFLASTRTPIITNTAEALVALGLSPRLITSAPCTSEPPSAATSLVAGR